MIRIFLVIAAIAASVWALRWFLRSPPAVVSRQIKKTGIYIIIGVLVLLAASGRLNWLIPLIGAVFALFARSLPHLLRFAPLLHRIWVQMRGPGTPPASSGSASNRSTVEARFIRMRLNHQTGEIDGEIIEGRFAGKHLNELSKSQIVGLYHEYRGSDTESASLVEAYLDRICGEDWRSSDTSENDNRSERSESMELNKEEAYRILGLEPGACAEDIKAAHRRLIQKFHPDRGGSTYLAAKINQAKNLLIG